MAGVSAIPKVSAFGEGWPFAVQLNDFLFRALRTAYANGWGPQGLDGTVESSSRLVVDVGLETAPKESRFKAATTNPADR